LIDAANNGGLGLPTIVFILVASGLCSEKTFDFGGYGEII
jgi:hypothetical protein